MDPFRASSFLVRQHSHGPFQKIHTSSTNYFPVTSMVIDTMELMKRV